MKITLFILILSLPITIFSQNNFDKKLLVGRSFWTKFTLATESECEIKISPTDIITNNEYCKFDVHLETNTKITLKRIVNYRTWAKLVFEDTDKTDFKIYLKNNSKRNFRRSFNLAFSRKEISEDAVYHICPEKNKIEVIKNLGFPTSIRRNGKNEEWYFDPGWIGGPTVCGYDAMTIKMKAGVITQISGIV